MLSELLFKNNKILKFNSKGETNIKISSTNCETLSRVILMDQNKQMTIELLKKVAKLDIEDFVFKRLKTMENIEEYKFSIIILKVILRDGTSRDVYMKLVRKNRIKESIFCYWCLLYDEKFKGNQEKQYTTITNSVKIIERESEACKNTVSLNVEENQWGVLKYGSDIHLVKFQKFLEQEKENDVISRWKNYLLDDSQDVLFVGIVKDD